MRKSVARWLVDQPSTEAGTRSRLMIQKVVSKVATSWALATQADVSSDGSVLLVASFGSFSFAGTEEAESCVAASSWCPAKSAKGFGIDPNVPGMAIMAAPLAPLNPGTGAGSCVGLGLGRVREASVSEKTKKPIAATRSTIPQGANSASESRFQWS